MLAVIVVNVTSVFRYMIKGKVDQQQRHPLFNGIADHHFKGIRIKKDTFFLSKFATHAEEEFPYLFLCVCVCACVVMG